MFGHTSISVCGLCMHTSSLSFPFEGAPVLHSKRERSSFLQIETIRVNVLGALNLADICSEKGIHLTMYATGCIYHYDKDFPQGSGRGFTEDDKPNFTGSYYSYTKVSSSWEFTKTSPLWNADHYSTLLTVWVADTTLFLQALVESLLKEYSNILILRVRMPIVADLLYPRNFITKILKYEKVSLLRWSSCCGPIHCVVFKEWSSYRLLCLQIIDIPNSMTVLPELLPLSVTMVFFQLTDQIHSFGQKVPNHSMPAIWPCFFSMEIRNALSAHVTSLRSFVCLIPGRSRKTILPTILADRMQLYQDNLSTCRQKGSWQG